MTTAQLIIRALPLTLIHWKIMEQKRKKRVFHNKEKKNQNWNEVEIHHSQQGEVTTGKKKNTITIA